MRRAIAWALIVGLMVLAVLAYMGSAWLFAIYLAALGNAVSFHWWYACSRCSNTCCSFNARSPEFFARFTPLKMVGEPVSEFSDIRSLVAGIPLLVSVAIGVVGAWLYSPAATIAWLAYMGLVGYAYWRTSCAGCGNECPANRNPAYRTWKQGSV